MRRLLIAAAGGFLACLLMGAGIGVTRMAISSLSSGSAASGQVPEADGSGGMTWTTPVEPAQVSPMSKPTIGSSAGNWPDESVTSNSHTFDVSGVTGWTSSAMFVVVRAYLTSTTAADSLTRLYHKLPAESVDGDPDAHTVYVLHAIDDDGVGTTDDSGTSGSAMLLLPINSSGVCNLWWDASWTMADEAVSVVGFL